MDGSQLNKEEKKDTITSLMLLTNKREGRIKGKSCAYGYGQSEKFEKEDASPQQLQLKAFLLHHPLMHTGDVMW